MFQAGGAIQAGGAETKLKLARSCLAENKVLLFLICPSKSGECCKQAPLGGAIRSRSKHFVLELSAVAQNSEVLQFALANIFGSFISMGCCTALDPFGEAEQHSHRPICNLG